MADPKTQKLREAFAEYAGVKPEEVGAFDLVFEVEVAGESSLHTLWSSVPYMQHRGMLGELEYQIFQGRMKEEAREQMEQLMNNG